MVSVEVRLSMKYMRHRNRAHRVLVMDGDPAHFEQSRDLLQGTIVRIPHPDRDCALVWKESVIEHSGYVWKWLGTGGFLSCTESEGERRTRNSCSEDSRSPPC
jgi:hypothetical protein